MQANKLPLVSVRLMTYNHADFIKDAMIGIMNQRTNFLVEVVVGDDFSTDNTLVIIHSYSETDNIKIKILNRSIGGEYWQKRQKLGRLFNFANILENCKGKYIALLDGDDYWTDPYKLQKQVDFLEANPDYGLVYTDIKPVDENGNALQETPSFVGLRDAYKSGSIFFDLLNVNFVTTPTVCFRAKLMPKEFAAKWYVYDMWIWLNIAMVSKIKFFNTITAAYRKHPGGITNVRGHLAARQIHIYADVVTKFLRDKHRVTEDKAHQEIFYIKVLGVFMSKKILFNIKTNLIKLLFIRGYLLSFLWWATNFKIRQITK